jgi:AcrR family transcriptional regulator
MVLQAGGSGREGGLGAKGTQTRRAVLQAAIARFGREGYRSTSVADIARDASVGGTVAYAYFASKEALFLAAVDEDAAALIDEAVGTVLAEPVEDWPQKLIFTLIEYLDHHPLARRLLAGLEPDVTARVLEIPALEGLRKASAERLSADQAAGLGRTDIDPVAVAHGTVTIMLSLLMSVVQLGPDATSRYAADVAAVLKAAIEPPPPAGGPPGPTAAPGSAAPARQRRRRP